MSRHVSTGKSMDVLVRMAATELGRVQSYDDDDDEDDTTLSLTSDTTVDLNNEEVESVTPAIRDTSTEIFLNKV